MSDIPRVNPVSAGRVSGKTLNKIIDRSNRLARDMKSPGEALDYSLRPGEILVKNTSGAEILRGDPVFFSNLRYTGPDLKNGSQVPLAVAFDATVHEVSRGWGVALAPIQVNDLGRVQLSGPVVSKISGSDGFRYAMIDKTTGEAIRGPVGQRIIGGPDGIADGLCLLNLGEAGLPVLNITVTEEIAAGAEGTVEYDGVELQATNWSTKTAKADSKSALFEGANGTLFFLVRGSEEFAFDGPPAWWRDLPFSLSITAIDEDAPIDYANDDVVTDHDGEEDLDWLHEDLADSCDLNTTGSAWADGRTLILPTVSGGYTTSLSLVQLLRQYQIAWRDDTPVGSVTPYKTRLKYLGGGSYDGTGYYTLPGHAATIQEKFDFCHENAKTSFLRSTYSSGNGWAGLTGATGVEHTGDTSATAVGISAGLLSYRPQTGFECSSIGWAQLHLVVPIRVHYTNPLSDGSEWASIYQGYVPGEPVDPSQYTHTWHEDQWLANCAGFNYKIIRNGIDPFPANGAKVIASIPDGFISYGRIVNLRKGWDGGSTTRPTCTQGIPVSSAALAKIKASTFNGFFILYWPVSIHEKIWSYPTVSHWPFLNGEAGLYESYGASAVVGFSLVTGVYD